MLIDFDLTVLFSCLPFRYTVNLVVFFVDKKLPGMFDCFSFWTPISCLRHLILSAEMPERTGVSQPLLPMSAKGKDSKSVEEQHKLLNGKSADNTDWVCININFSWCFFIGSKSF